MALISGYKNSGIVIGKKANVIVVGSLKLADYKIGIKYNAVKILVLSVF